MANLIASRQESYYRQCSRKHFTLDCNRYALDDSDDFNAVVDDYTSIDEPASSILMIQ